MLQIDDNVILTILILLQYLTNQILADQTELNCRQQATIQNICDTLQKACSQITNSHRELHIPVSKIGKTIDKNFNSDFACASDVNLFKTPENEELLNNAIAQHFLSQGMANVAKDLIREARLPVSIKEFNKFDEVDSILTALRKKDVSLVLKWAIENRDRLKELKSPLEFKIHRLNIINLLNQGMDKQNEIIQYAREYMQNQYPTNEEETLELSKLMGCLLFLKTGLKDTPYESFLDPMNYDEIENIFVNNVCTLLDIGSSPISVAVNAGCVALPALLNISQILSNQGVREVWNLREELPVDIDLGRELQFHSTFSCPILKQQSTEINPPMKLICGHVISKDALHKISGSSNANKLKCPYCPVEQSVSDAVQVYF